MPVTLHEETLDMTLEVLQAVPVRPEGPLPASYPLPMLAREGRESHRQLPCLVLQNEFIAAWICPSLGGRIVRLTDKRTQSDLWPRLAAQPCEEGGPRGLWLPWGITPWIGESVGPSRGEAAKVDAMTQEPEDDESPAAILLHSLCPGQDLSWQAAWTLHPGQASLLFELKLLNRSLLPSPAFAGLWIEAPEPTLWSEGDSIGASAAGGRAWHLESPSCWAETRSGGILLHPGVSPSPLLPREAWAWSARLTPFTGLGTPQAVSPLAGVGESDGSLLIQASRRVLDASLRLQTSSEALEASSDLNPESHLAIPADPSDPPQTLFIESHPLRLNSPLPLPPRPAPSAIRLAVEEASRSPQSPSVESLFFQALTEGQPAPPTPVPGMDHARWAALGHEALAKKDWPEASRLFEQSLLTNGEDVLCWWAKAWAAREISPGEERPELLNAHFLSPMEPSLRAESFLQQGALHGKDPVPTIRPLAKNPDAALDVIHRILECGRVDEANLLMDEILRHEEIPMVRLLMAWLLVTKSRMKVEAATHVRAIEGRGLTPPFPWRRLELQAARETAEAFPDSDSLRTLALLAQLANDRR